jgi:hypothetical protein
MRDMGLYRGKRVDNGEWVEGFFTMTKWSNCQSSENKGTWHEPVWEMRSEYAHQLKCRDFNRGRYWFAAIQQSKNLDSILEVDPATVGEFVRELHGKRVFEGDQGLSDTGEVYTMAYIEKYQRFAWIKPGTVFAMIPDDRIALTGTTIHDAKEGGQ